MSQQLQAGTVRLRRDGPSGFLASVLHELQISVDSQILVFNKDSVQANRISPTNPRSLFFNDTTVVGRVRGGFIELASEDPKQGVVFYSLDNRTAATGSIVRRDDCVSCHDAYGSVGAPGMLDRSFLQFSVTHPTYARLTRDTRATIIDILRAPKPTCRRTSGLSVEH